MINCLFLYKTKSIQCDISTLPQNLSHRYIYPAPFSSPPHSCPPSSSSSCLPFPSIPPSLPSSLPSLPCPPGPPCLSSLFRNLLRYIFTSFLSTPLHRKSTIRSKVCDPFGSAPNLHSFEHKESSNVSVWIAAVRKSLSRSFICCCSLQIVDIVLRSVLILPPSPPQNSTQSASSPRLSFPSPSCIPSPRHSCLSVRKHDKQDRQEG